VLASYAFSSSSDLYRELVVEEQTVDQLFASFPDRVDPNLLTIGARVKDPADVWAVRDRIQQALAGLRANGVEAERMEAIKSNLKYGFANALDNSPAIAGALASYLAATREVETINEVYARYDALTPADVQAAANDYFTDRGMVVTTLAHGDLPEVESETGTVDGLVAGAARRGAAPSVARAVATPDAADPVARPARVPDASGEAVFTSIVQRSASPLVDVRFLFLTGPAADPEGKEGLAELTARMVADAGSRAMTYAEIQQALFPLAAGFGAQVDKEMTVFGGRTHRDNLDRYYEIVSAQLLDPGFREEDFQRVRSNLLNDIRVGLRA